MCDDEKGGTGRRRERKRKRKREKERRRVEIGDPVGFEESFEASVTRGGARGITKHLSNDLFLWKEKKRKKYRCVNVKCSKHAVSDFFAFAPTDSNSFDNKASD